jgi:diacylglycerol kinase family enzyme
MAEDPIRKYSESNDELEKARTKVQKVQAIIVEVGQALNYPYQFVISNVGVGFPAEVTHSSMAKSLNANEWPTAKQIAEVIADLHQRRQHLESAWHSLSDADKNIVKPLSTKQ